MHTTRIDWGKAKIWQSAESFIGLVEIQMISWVSDDKNLCPIDMCNKEEDPEIERNYDVELGVNDVYIAVEGVTVNEVTIRNISCLKKVGPRMEL